MRDLRFGDFVHVGDEGWIYCGMTDDGAIHFCRPVKDIAYEFIEFNTLYPNDEPEAYDDFMRANGESLREYRKRIKP